MKRKKSIFSDVIRNIGLPMGVFGLVLLCLYLIMVLFATIPNQGIWENMAESARYELTVDRYDVPENAGFQQMADNYADQIWLNIAWQMGNGDPFVSVLDTVYYDGEEFGEAAGLYQTVIRGAAPNQSYSRYWHGSAALLRFLHLWTDIQGSKILGMLMLLAFIFATVRILFRDGHGDLAMCLLASLVGIQVFQLRLSFEYLPCFLVCFGFCPLYLKWEKRGDYPLILLSVAVGVMTAFFDFLTVETITVTVPLILVLAAREMDGRLISKRDTAMLLLCCLLWWGMAYLGTYLVKWIAAAAAVGGNPFTDALQSMSGRLDGMVLVNGEKREPGMLLGIGANLSVLFGGLDRTSYRKVFSGLFLCGLILYVLIRLYRTRSAIRRGTGFILCLGMVVFLRYAVLANHSYLHAFFTYRALLSTILAILTVSMLNLRPRKRGRRRRRWN